MVIAVIRTCSVVCLAAVLIGCAPQSWTTPSPTIRAMSEAQRRSVSSITLLATRDLPEPTVQVPWMQSNARGKGAAKGAKDALAGSAQFAVQTGEAGLFMFAVVAPIVTPIASASAASRAKKLARPDAEVRSEEKQLRGAIATLTPLYSATTHTGLALRRAGCPVQPVSGTAFSTNSMRLEIAIERFGLYGPDEVEPRLRPTLALRGRLIDGVSGEEIYLNVWECQGPARTFTEWSRSGYKEIQREFDVLHSRLANRMTEEMFMLCEIE